VNAQLLQGEFHVVVLHPAHVQAETPDDDPQAGGDEGIPHEVLVIGRIHPVGRQVTAGGIQGTGIGPDLDHGAKQYQVGQHGGMQPLDGHALVLLQFPPFLSADSIIILVADRGQRPFPEPRQVAPVDRLAVFGYAAEG